MVCRETKWKICVFLLSVVFLVAVYTGNAYAKMISYEITIGEECHVVAYEQGGNLIYVEPGTSAKFVLEVVNNFTEATVCNREGQVAGEDESVLNGYKVVSTSQDYDITILGDSTGDGSVDVLDMEAQQKHILGIQELDEEFLMAALLSDGSQVSVLDMEIIQKHILGIFDIYENICGERGVHDGGYLEYQWEPTCNSTGEAARRCGRCGAYVEWIVIPETEHQYEYVDSVEATCKNGAYDNYVCTQCGVTTEIITGEPLEHTNTYGYIEEFATCTEEGIYEIYCLDCGRVVERKAIPKEEHAWEELEVLEEATVDKEGLISCKCYVCGFCENQTIPKKVAPLDENVYLEINGTTQLGLYNSESVSFRISNDKGVFTIDENGLITAKDTIGTGHVYITDIYGKEHYVYVKVVENIEGYFIYDIVDDHVELTGHTLEGEDVEEVVVPAYIDGYPVTKVCRFGDCESVKTVTLPNTLAGSGSYLDGAYESIETVIFEDGITDVPAYICRNLESLKKVVLPDSVTLIGKEAFSGCTSLEEIAISNVETIGTEAFKNCSELVLNGLPDNIVKVYENAFYNCGNVVINSLPDSLRYIYNDALKGCQVAETMELSVNIVNAEGLDGVQKLVFEEGRTSISASLFGDYESLEEVVLPQSLTYIGSRTFEGCPLKTITIPKNVNSCPGLLNVYGPAFEFSSIETIIFEEGMETIPYSLCGYASSIKNIVLPSTVKTISDYAFYGTSVEHLVLPEGLETLGNSCFADCGSLKTLSIPHTVTSAGSALAGAAFEFGGLETVTFTGEWVDIPQSIFSNCGNLKEVILPDSVKTIGMYAFYACGSLTTINFPDGLERIGDSAFNGCGSLTEVTIPSSVTCLGSEDASGFGSAFEYSGLETVHLQEGMTEIPDYAFIHCEKLKDIQLPSTLTKIGDYAFDYCYSIESLELPDSLTEVGMCAFANTTGLKTINIPKSLTTFGWVVGGGPFEYSGLEEVTLEEGTEAIYEGVFMYCSNLTKINIPTTVTLIDNYAFMGCTALTEFKIPNHVTEMGYWVFFDSGVTEVSVPASVTRLGSDSMSTFEGSNIKKVILEEGIETIDEAQFANCNGLVEVVCPSTLKSIDSNAFTGCASLKEFVVPDSVTIIGALAFAECASLEKVTIPASVTVIGDDLFMHILIDSETYPTIVTTEGSVAHDYAIANGYNVELQ